MLLYIIISVILVSLVSLIGVIFFKLRDRNAIFWMLSFAAGSMLGAVFFDLMPELLEKGDAHSVLLNVFLGLIGFFLLERCFHCYHCHHDKRGKEHSMGKLSLYGDAIHNFLDGCTIAAAYLTNVSAGIVTTLAILFHEIPQEIGDYGVLLYSGFTRKKAIIANLSVSLTAIAGALMTYYFAQQIESFSSALTAIAAGGLMYIASSDIIPELHKEKELNASIIQFLLVVFGAGLIYWLSFLLQQ